MTDRDGAAGQAREKRDTVAMERERVWRYLENWAVQAEHEPRPPGYAEALYDAARLIKSGKHVPSRGARLIDGTRKGCAPTRGTAK